MWGRREERVDYGYVSVIVAGRQLCIVHGLEMEQLVHVAVFM
jgi:hypothetical protein